MHILQTAIILAALAPAASNETRAEAVRSLTEPIRDAEMSSMVPGTVAKIHYGEGSFVKEGTVVLELDSKAEELDVQRRSVLVDTLKATLERSEMLLKNTSSISMEEVDEARSDYQIALIELELAREALNKKQVRVLFSGYITDLPTELGEYCEPPQILLRIVDPRQFYCVANIDPARGVQLKTGDTVVFKPDLGGEAHAVTGEIVFISPVVDSASGLMRIRALFSNTDGKIRPGEAGDLELSTVD